MPSWPVTSDGAQPNLLKISSDRGSRTMYTVSSLKSKQKKKEFSFSQTAIGMGGNDQIRAGTYGEGMLQRYCDGGGRGCMEYKYKPKKKRKGHAETYARRDVYEDY
jgi:hypothetical protein